MRQIHQRCRGTRVELLIPDFDAEPGRLREIFGSRPEVLAHNIETVHRVFRRIRPPHLVRLVAWNELERPQDSNPEAVREANAKKVALIASAQRQGTISDKITPKQLLGVITHLSLANSPGSPAAIWTVDSDRRREAIVRAARALL